MLTGREHVASVAPRQPEVGNVRYHAAIEQDVLGLEVAVQDVQRVQVRHALRDMTNVN